MSPISKVIEKVVIKQIVSFLNRNKILYKHQYGFRESLSTGDAIRKCHETLIRNKKTNSVIVAIDLKKAFDTVRFDLLLYKLKLIGFSKSFCEWLKSYLNDRYQYVEIKLGKNKYKSKKKNWS